MEKSKWKVYISSTFKDLKEYRSQLINLFQTDLKKQFELTEIMEWMFDDGSQTPFIEDCKKAVIASDIYVLILGNKTGSFPPGEERTYTEIELDTAIEEGKMIFFLHLKEFDDKEIDNKAKHNEIREKFKGKNAHRFKSHIEFENIIFKCLTKFAADSPVNRKNPYKGLAAFTVDDGDYFFGRQAEVEACLKKITTTEGNTFISIIGNSGTGKSSFVQAGILFKLKHIAELGFSNFVQVIITPGKEPYTNLKYQLKLKGISIEDFKAPNFSTDLILFFDQFEEVITQCHSNESQAERAKLFDFLDSLVDNPNIKSKILVITTFRSDFYSQLANYKFIQTHQFTFPLSSLDYSVNEVNWEESIREIITRPALGNKVEIETELVDRLVHEIKEVEGSLPILQFTLQQIWNDQTIKDRLINSKEYNQLSGSRGLTGILETHAENVIGRLTRNGEDKKKESIVKSIFVNLTEVNENSLDIKRTVTKEELFSKLSMYPDQIVIEIFEFLVSERGRLITVIEDRDKSLNVNIVHEVLIRKWERLRGWINERRDALQFRKRLLGDVASFKKGEENVYSTEKLKRANDWKNKNPDLSNTDIDAFLKKLEALYRINQKKHFIQAMHNNESLSEQMRKVGDDFDSIKNLSIVGDVALKILSEKFSYFKNIEELRLYRLTNITDLSVLEKIEHPAKIGVLSVGNIDLNNLNGIENLTNVQRVYIDDCDELMNLGGLTKLKHLKYLKIDDSRNLSNLPGLEQLKNLTGFAIRGSYFIQTIMSKTIMLNRLEILRIEMNEAVVDLKEVEALTSLKTFDLHNNKNLTSLCGIGKLTTLKSLSLTRNDNLTSLNDIEKLISLSSLYITDNQKLINFKAIEKINSLTSLTLGGHHDFSHFQDIEQLPSIKSLDLIHCFNIASLIGIEKFNNLDYLYISDNEMLTSLQGIENLSNINSIQLVGNRNLTNLRGIEKLDSLRRLIIKGPVPNLNFEAIYELTSLKELEIPQKSGLNIDLIKKNNRKVRVNEISDKSKLPS